MKTITSLLFICLFSLPASAQHSSDILLEEDWSSHVKGPLVSSSSWQISSPGNGLVVVVENPSPFGNSSRALKIEHTNRDSWGPRVTGAFPYPLAEPITISFDFMLDGDSNDQPTFRLEGSANESPGSGLWIALDNNGFPTSIPGRNIVNRLNDERANAVCPVRRMEWYRVVLEIADPAEEKFNIIVTPDGGAPVRVDGLPFRAPLIDYWRFSFFTNTEGGSGILYVTNIQVSTANN